MSSVLVVVVTGMSGAGKSTVLHALEDLAYFCIDNLPIPVIGSTLEACERGGVRRVALGIDVRVRSFLEGVPDVLQEITASQHRELQVVFLDASDEALLRRFSSTRRPHPLRYADEIMRAESLAVLDGVHLEREWLSPLRAQATHVIDTTALSVHDLRRRITSLYGPASEVRHGMQARVMSFGFKYGPPVDADVVLDVRFLDNPFFVDALRPLTGLDEPVRRYVLENPEASEFLDRTRALLDYCLPRYEREGKSHLTVALGCTGGRHRSVCLSEALAAGLRENERFSIEVVHRDLGRDTLVPGGRERAAPGILKEGK